MTDHNYHCYPDDDSGKWLVLDEEKKFAAGPFTTHEQAKAWIAQQNAIDEWTDS